jgi:ATP-dependent Zn protease
MLGRRARLHIQRSYERAFNLVLDHLTHIRALADELVKHGRVEGPEIYRIFEEQERSPTTKKIRGLRCEI